MTMTGNTELLGETPVPVPLLSTTNPTLTGLELNPVLRGEMPVTNRLSHGTANIGSCNAGTVNILPNGVGNIAVL
jgi:hypothetical protein